MGAKDTLIPKGHSLKRPLKELEQEDGWRSKVYKRMPGEEKAASQRRQQEYKDRAEMRRQKNKGEAGAAAIDGLVQKYELIRQAEEAAEEVEAGRTEMPTMEDQR